MCVSTLSFFPGEKFVLNATTSVISPLSSVKATNVTVRISGSSYNTTLANPSSVNWTGTLWGEDMIYWNSGPLSFVFTVTYSNGHVETDTVNVEIVRDDYWRVHHNF